MTNLTYLSSLIASLVTLLDLIMLKPLLTLCYTIFTSNYNIMTLCCVLIHDVTVIYSGRVIQKLLLAFQDYYNIFFMIKIFFHKQERESSRFNIKVE